MIAGFTVSYTEPATGTPHPDSFWQMHSMDIVNMHDDDDGDDDDNWQTVVTFRGWHDQTEKQAQKTFIPGAEIVVPMPIGPITPGVEVPDAIDGLYMYAIANVAEFNGAVTT